VKIGAAGFIVPFMFIYEPALLMIGPWSVVIPALVTASAGILLFAAGLHGYLITACALWQRAFLVGAGLLLVKPGLVTDLLGVALALAVIATQYAARRGAAPAKTQTAK
jgi:TRAP-type uncharacterized transport system fused permease subunit